MYEREQPANTTAKRLFANCSRRCAGTELAGAQNATRNDAITLRPGSGETFFKNEV